MKHYKKSLVGSIIVFFVGLSCCWLSSMAIWLGGATLVGVAIQWMESFQVLLILLSLVLAIISLYLYQKKKSKK